MNICILRHKWIFTDLEAEGKIWETQAKANLSLLTYVMFVDATTYRGIREYISLITKEKKQWKGTITVLVTTKNAVTNKVFG